MQNVPKIVTERLRAAKVSAEHPDADALTAFSERSLPDRDRGRVLEHLARCGECREIVMLALPVSEPAGEMVRRPSEGWLTWPVLRWGFVAAGIVAIVSLGTLRYRHQNASPPIAALYDARRSDTNQPEGVAKEAKNEALPVAGEPTKEEGKLRIPPTSAAVATPGESKPAAPKKQTRDFDRLETYSQLQAPAANRGNSLGGPLPHGPSVRQQTQQNSFYANNSQVQAPPPPAYAKRQPSTDLNAPAPVVPTNAGVSAASAPVQAQNQEGLVLQSKSMPLQPTAGGHGELVAKAKSPDLTASGTKVPIDSPAAPNAYGYVVGAAKGAANTRWTINSSGGLQRSVDQGSSWQDVNVSGLPSSAGSSMDLAMSALTKEADKDKADSGTNDKKVSQASPIVFRAVAANGPDVWAGGSAGMLYHSLDAGGHWTRVVPFSQGAILTGDIVSLEFFNTQNGRVTTSLAQIWTTADGGQTWQKQ